MATAHRTAKSKKTSKRKNPQSAIWSEKVPAGFRALKSGVVRKGDLMLVDGRWNEYQRSTPGLSVAYLSTLKVKVARPSFAVRRNPTFKAQREGQNGWITLGTVEAPNYMNALTAAGKAYGGGCNVERINPGPRRPMPRVAGTVDDPLATELASALMWKGANGPILVKHLEKTRKRPDFSRAKYVDFIAKAHIPRAAEIYFKPQDWRLFVNKETAKRAAEYWVDAILNGEWE